MLLIPAKNLKTNPGPIIPPPLPPTAPLVSNARTNNHVPLVLPSKDVRSVSNDIVFATGSIVSAGTAKGLPGKDAQSRKLLKGESKGGAIHKERGSGSQTNP